MTQIWTPSSTHLYTYPPLDFSHPPSLKDIMTGRDPRWFLEMAVKIPTQKGIKPFILYPWMHQVSYQGLPDSTIMLKSREIGSTTLWAALFLREVLTHPGGNLLIAANKEENAVNAIKYLKTMVQNLPESIKPKIGKYNETQIEFPELGNQIKALSGTEDSGRAERALYLLATEMAFWKNDYAYWMAVQGALVKGSKTVIESTANPESGTENLFHDLWDGQNEFRKHFWNVWSNPEHDDEWYKNKREGSPNIQLFLAEYPETPAQAFIVAADSFFSNEVIQQGQLDVRTPIDAVEFDNHKGWIHIWEKSVPGLHYVVGADVAEGEGSKENNPDWSDATIVDWQTGLHVATIHTQLPYSDYADMLFSYGKEYNNAHMVVERNGGGLGVISWLQAKKYPNMYYETKIEDEIRGVVKTIKNVGYRTTDNNKRVMLDELQVSMKSGRFRSPDILLWTQAKSINRATLKAMGKKKDDKVISAAIAEYVRRRYIPSASLPYDYSVRDTSAKASWQSMW